MKLARLVAAFVCVATFWGAHAGEAQAQTWGAYGCGGFMQPGWFGYAGSPYSLGQIPVPPYFAIHPPVYYSAPVPRTYGYSPYAYPGTMETPEIVMPELIPNPHATQPAEPENTSHVKVVRHQVIDNPFVRPELKAKLNAHLAASR